MKNFLLFAILILAFANCKVTEKALDGSHLTIEGPRKYIPFQYSTKQNICFTAENGESKCLRISYSDKTVEKQNESLQYSAEQIYIFLVDSVDTEVTILFSGGTNYWGVDQKKSIYVGCDLLNSDKCTWPFAFQVDKKGNPISDAFTKIEPTKTLNGKVFQECITIKNFRCSDQYSEMVVNSEFGVVAFRDKNNELFVFDKFE
jgi:hypothetical protein